MTIFHQPVLSLYEFLMLCRFLDHANICNLFVGDLERAYILLNVQI